MPASLRVALLLLYLLPQAFVHVDARGVLSIKLLSFENRPGRTYEGQCCDPTPKDDTTCYDQCDYVMRLIISGLGRANDHVFLFHRPLKYDSNDLQFQEHSRDLTLTVLFDRWPEEGHVKMNAFFYDYDDFDHTTALVDWFETELSGHGQVNKDGPHELLISGNRQSEKTRLKFVWSRHCDPKKPEGETEDCESHLKEDQQSSPWKERNASVNKDKQDPVSGKSNQQMYPHNDKSEDDSYRKSPFKPFSTRRHKMKSDQPTILYTPTLLHSNEQKSSKDLELNKLKKVNDIKSKTGALKNKVDTRIKSGIKRRKTNELESKNMSTVTESRAESPFKHLRASIKNDKKEHTRDEQEIKYHSSVVNIEKEPTSKAAPRVYLSAFTDSNRNPFYNFTGLREIAPFSIRSSQATNLYAAMASMEKYSHTFINSKNQQTMKPPIRLKKPTHAVDKEKRTSHAAVGTTRRPKQNYILKKNPTHASSRNKVNKIMTNKNTDQKLKQSPFKPTIKPTRQKTRTTTMNPKLDSMDTRKLPLLGEHKTEKKKSSKQVNNKPTEAKTDIWIMEAKNVSTTQQKTQIIYTKLQSKQNKLASLKKSTKGTEVEPTEKRAVMSVTKNINSVQPQNALSKTKSNASSAMILETSVTFQQKRPIVGPHDAHLQRVNLDLSKNGSFFSVSMIPVSTQGSRSPITEKNYKAHSTNQPKSLTISPATSSKTKEKRGWGPLHKNRFVTWIPATPAANWAPRSQFRARSRNTKKLFSSNESITKSVSHEASDLFIDTSATIFGHNTYRDLERLHTKSLPLKFDENHSLKLAWQNPIDKRNRSGNSLSKLMRNPPVLWPHSVHLTKTQAQSKSAMTEDRKKENTPKQASQTKPVHHL